METVKKHYRHLHQYPELSCQEEKTSAYVGQVLQELGYQPRRFGKYGVAADLLTGEDLPWLVFRADMDALPVLETSGLSWSSENRGVMHACGHDSHTAMLLGAAQALKQKNLPQNIRFVFQSGEEVTEGAREIIAAGVMPKNVKACFAVHVWPGVPFGRIATCPGALMAFTDRIRIAVTGKSAHCGQQHKGINALTCASRILEGFPKCQALAKDPRTVLFCGSLHSGDAHNVVPERAELTGTLRTFLEEDCQTIKQALEQVCREAEAAVGAKVQLCWENSVPALNNDAGLIEKLCKLFENVDPQIQGSATAEDFALFQRCAPGVLVWLGLGDVPPLHNSGFYVPEEVLPVGVNFWKTLAEQVW